MVGGRGGMENCWKDKALGQSLLSLQMTGSSMSSADGLPCTHVICRRTFLYPCHLQMEFPALELEREILSRAVGLLSGPDYLERGKRSHLSRQFSALLSVPSCCLTCSSNTLLSTAHSSFALYDTTLYWFLGRSLTPSKSPYQ